MDQDNSHLEIGRRLLAAVLSYRYGIGLDYTLKRYVPQQIDPSWGELGWTLLKAIANQSAAPINPGKLN
jgi:hypothetical protein